MVRASVKGTEATYQVYVKGLDEGKLLSRGNVEVSCSCGDFWSHWEVALNKQGAALIIHSNGEKPRTTNPKMVPGTCKHSAALLKYVIDSQI